MATIRKVVPQLAAAMMGKDPQFVRIGLQRGLLPFGKAIETGSNGRVKRYSYYISPKQFMDYTGFTEADIIAAAEAGGFSY